MPPFSSAPFARPNLDLVLFDMDDVLARYDVATRLGALSQATGLPPAAIRAAIWESDYFGRADSGEWDARGCLEEFSKRLGVPVSRDVWVSARRVSLTPFPEMFDLLERLKTSGAAIGLLSNNCALTGETLDELAPGLRALTEPRAWVSAQFGRLKPDPELFRLACARAGADPARTLFVDDLAENVAGARAAGLRGHRFDGREGLERALAELSAPGEGV
jgi:putative hydrolase of the HAD superfamily